MADEAKINAAHVAGHASLAETNRLLDLARTKYFGVAAAAAKAAAAESAPRFNAAQSINQVTGITASGQFDAKERAADIKAYSVETERARAKFDPLFAAGRRYRETLGEISNALKVGALDERQAAAALERTKEAFATEVREINKIKPAKAEAAAGLNAIPKAAAGATETIRLKGYQVQNLAAQFTCLAVQVGSGGGLFRPCCCKRRRRWMPSVASGALWRSCGSTLRRYSAAAPWSPWPAASP